MASELLYLRATEVLVMEPSGSRAGTRRSRIELQLDDHADARRFRELGAFARYCVSRIEHDLGQVEHWIVKVTPSLGGFTSKVVVQDRDYSAEAVASGFDGALAIWDAMCRLEQGLREARARRGYFAPPVRFEAE